MGWAAGSCRCCGLSTRSCKHCVVRSDLRRRGAIKTSATISLASCRCHCNHSEHAPPFLYLALLLQVQSNNSSSGSSTNGALGQVSLTDINKRYCPCELSHHSMLVSAPQHAQVAVLQCSLASQKYRWSQARRLLQRVYVLSEVEPSSAGVYSGCCAPMRRCAASLRSTVAIRLTMSL